MRAAVGPDVQVFVDGHGRFSVGTASQLAHELAEAGVDWFEEPVDPENFIALGQVARPPGLQIAVGERCYSRYQIPQLLAQGRPHIIQPDPIQVGGLLEAKKIAVLADSGLPAGVLPLPVWPDRDRRDPSALRRDNQCRPSGILFGVRRRLAPRAHHELSDACRRQLPGEHASQAWAASSSTRRSCATTRTRNGRCNRCGRSTAPCAPARGCRRRTTAPRLASRETQPQGRKQRNQPPKAD